MHSVLVVTSDHRLADALEFNRLRQQIDFLRSLAIKVDCLVDPQQAELELKVLSRRFICAFTTTMHSFGSEKSLSDRPRPFNVVRSFQQLGQHYVGCPVFTQILVDDKTLTARLLTGAAPGVLISRAVFEAGGLERVLRELPRQLYPVLVKPNSLLGSLGITGQSVAKSKVDVVQRVGTLFQRFLQLQEVRIEALLGIRCEVTVSVLGNGKRRILSITELATTDGRHQINGELDKRAKPPERRLKYRVLKDASLRKILAARALEYFDVLKMRDFARFDFAIDQEPYLLDANSLPVAGSAFSWEWKVKYDLREEQILALLFLVSLMRHPVPTHAVALIERLCTAVPPSMRKQLVGRYSQASL